MTICRGVKAISNNFEEDLREILEVVIDKLREKYVAPFEEVVRSKDADLKNNPSPEINLLNAFKPFVNDKCCRVIDKVVSSYQVATVANAITDDILQAQVTGTNSADASHSRDGVSVSSDGDRGADGGSTAMGLGNSLMHSNKVILIIIFAFLIILLETH